MSVADGRVAHLTVACMCDNGGTTKETPATAGTVRGHDRTAKEFDMSNGTRDIALDYLARAHEDMVRAATLRLERMGLARKYGATNQQIAEAAGITESAVRAMLIRHGDA